ncbi:NUDIX hydrolase [Natronorubrum sulfidifaciens]|uniref:NUDIX hydrolase n=1 Tax=Natronorubrum sulfidifaciens JCM 14089 TaxID=1230460 RepID=L9WDN0_9EURY|nr:NUDIX hydrolase [Natronorubrum sulfidifaciens]ELY47590.1 NUDIX hydrolase [Natronorubrum sulfidifaciens JCM 14089]
MVSRPADYCPRCGTSLESTTVDGRERERCPACENVIWHNPVPCASVAVVDRSRPEPAVLCIERAVPPGVGEWTLPGGHMEVGEEPAVAAARELEEETGVSIAADALEILDATAMPPRNGKHVTTIHYVADWTDASGEPLAGSDANTARFWSPAAFDASGETFRPIHEQWFRAAVTYFG